MKKQHITLTNDHRIYLQNLIKNGQLSARACKRALALLELDHGRTYTEVAKIVNVTKQTASAWARKYKETGLDFLVDKPRPGRPSVIDDLARANIKTLASNDAPEGHERWSLRLLANKAVELEFVDEVSHTEVGRILKKANLNPTAGDTGASAR